MEEWMVYLQVKAVSFFICKSYCWSNPYGLQLRWKGYLSSERYTIDCLCVQIDEGDTSFDGRKRQLLWSIDLIDRSNQSGTLEFVVPACSPEQFLPVTVHFTSGATLCDMTVLGVTNTRTDAPAKYKLETQLLSEMYEIV